MDLHAGSEPAGRDQRSADLRHHAERHVADVAQNTLSVFGSLRRTCVCATSRSARPSRPKRRPTIPATAASCRAAGPSTLTNRLLFEAGARTTSARFPAEPQPDATEPSILEQSTNLRFRSGATYFPTPQTVDDYRCVAVVRDRRAQLQGRVHLLSGSSRRTRSCSSIGDVNYRTLNGIPNQVTYYTTPYAAPLYLKPFGAFVQDQLNVQPLDDERAACASTSSGARTTRSTSSRCGGCRWRATIPGAEVLELEGPVAAAAAWPTICSETARTALKFSLAATCCRKGKGNTNNVHPVIAATNSVSRTWTDRNGDFIVQGDPLNPALNGELGPSPNNNFGKPNTTLRFDPDWATGFNARPYNWEMLVTLQHELAAAGRGRGHLQPADRTATSSSTTTRWCARPTTIPTASPRRVDARLPDGGGQQICGLFDLKPAKVGQVDTLRTYSRKVRRSDRALERPRRVDAGALPRAASCCRAASAAAGRRPTTATSWARWTTRARTSAIGSRRSCRR